MNEIEVSESRAHKRMRWAARIISLLPGAGIILFYWGYWGLYLFMTKGLDHFGFRMLPVGLKVGVPPLIPGGISWRWPRVGSILQIAFAAYLFILFIRRADWPPEGLLSIASAFLIGGVLHLIVSPWGQGLWHRSNKT
jgi:hypothetical protein